jgi:peptidyl-tRNA hydrolase, PTH1 family
VDWVIAGLGNPGKKYAQTRHNAGFMLIDLLAKEHDMVFDELSHKGMVARGKIGPLNALLVKPQAYMNLSGETIAPICRFYKVPFDHLLVVCDDIDIPLGTLRLRPGGGSAGHRGMQSIIQQLGSDEFPRLRIGVSRPPGNMAAEDYVLLPLNPAEAQVLEISLKNGLQAIETILTDGLEAAMNRFNQKQMG